VRLLWSVLAGLLLALGGLVPAPHLPSPARANPPDTCGVWRWGVKTLSDGNASQVNFTPRARTIRSLRALVPPDALGKGTPRVRPTEYRVYRLRARLLEHKWVCCGGDDDGDYHLVLADPRNRARTMVAEIPDPACPGARNSARVSALSHQGWLTMETWQRRVVFEHSAVGVCCESDGS
jgi:hypothetical protein